MPYSVIHVVSGSTENAYRKVPKFSDAKTFAVINLKFEQRGQTLGYLVKKTQME